MQQTRGSLGGMPSENSAEISIKGNREFCFLAFLGQMRPKRGGALPMTDKSLICISPWNIIVYERKIVVRRNNAIKGWKMMVSIK